MALSINASVALKLARSKGYGWFSERTDEQAARALGITVNMARMAREFAHDDTASIREQFNRAGFNGSKS